VAATTDQILISVTATPPIVEAPLAQRTNIVVIGQPFDLDAEYDFVKELGQGSHGLAIAARHRRSGIEFAVKKITDIKTKVHCL
jgi:hypothetical protein